MSFRQLSYILIISLIGNTISCQTTPAPEQPEFGVSLPYIKNTANECYYLDEFMPIPDSLVSGKSGRLRLRYYTYKSAQYKDLKDKHIILSFYSSDEKCWSLFEEYYMTD